MPERRYQPTIDQDVADHGVRIDREEKKVGPRPPAVPVNLDQLKDVAIPYRNPAKAPKNGQVFTWHADDTIPTYKGWWEPGAKVDKGYATDSGTGDLSISVDLVDGDWDTTRACRVEATMLIDPAYSVIGAELSASVTIDGDPFTLVIPDTAGVAFVSSPVATLQLIDADAGPGAPSADVEVGTAQWAVAAPHTSGDGNTGNGASWTFTGGTPHIEANITGVNTDAWPESHTIYVIWRLTYL